MSRKKRLPPCASHHSLDIRARQVTPLRNRGHILRLETGSELLGQDDEQLPDFVLVRGIEERDMNLGASLTLQVDRQQVGTRGQ